MNEFDNEVEENDDPYESPLAKEFEQVCKDAKEQINAKLEEAHAALEQAEKIADQYGVPFRSHISPLSNSYVPTNFSESKFGKLDKEVVCEIAGVWGEYIRELLGGNYGGWIHSAVCY